MNREKRVSVLPVTGYRRVLELILILISLHVFKALNGSCLKLAFIICRLWFLLRFIHYAFIDVIHWCFCFHYFYELF